jgi:hypothetical protein
VNDTYADQWATAINETYTNARDDYFWLSDDEVLRILRKAAECLRNEIPQTFTAEELDLVRHLMPAHEYHQSGAFIAGRPLPRRVRRCRWRGGAVSEGYSVQRADTSVTFLIDKWSPPHSLTRRTVLSAKVGDEGVDVDIREYVGGEWDEPTAAVTFTLTDDGTREVAKWLKLVADGAV